MNVTISVSTIFYKHWAFSWKQENYISRQTREENQLHLIACFGIVLVNIEATKKGILSIVRKNLTVKNYLAFSSDSNSSLLLPSSISLMRSCNSFMEFVMISYQHWARLKLEIRYLYSIEDWIKLTSSSNFWLHKAERFSRSFRISTSFMLLSSKSRLILFNSSSSSENKKPRTNYV